MSNKLSFYFLIAILFFVLNSCTTKKDEIKFFPIKSGEKWGYVDRNGKYVINSQFEDAFNFSEGLALFKSADGKYGFIGENGKYVINPIYKAASKFSEGLACVVMENGKPQFINKEGKIIFTVDKADYCQSFSEGMAEVKINGKWGYIDKTGKIVINPIYESSNKFSEGLGAVSKIDEKTKEEKWGFIDKTGAVKINFQFISDKSKIFCVPEGFTEGLAFVSSDGKQWGCIDENGKYQVNPQFEGEIGNPYAFKNGVSLIVQGKNYGYIDKQGKYLINPQYKNALPFSSNGLAAVQHSDGKWGFINKEGKYEINPQFDEVAKGFIGNIAFVKAAEKYGIIDKKGLYIINPQFDDVKLYDIDYTYGVKSDYVNNEVIAEQLFSNSSFNKYMGYSQATTLGDIVDEYPEKSIDDLETYSLKVDNPKIKISDIVDLNSLTYGFDEKTYSENPIYKTVRKYDSYYGYYNTQEIDRIDKKIQTDAPLSYTALRFTLLSKGEDKGRSLVEAIKEHAIKTMNVKQVESVKTVNDKEKGYYILSNENFLIYLSYRYNNNDKKDEEPVVQISVINKNFDKGFEELSQKLAADFQ